jgi:hypothetical protein
MSHWPIHPHPLKDELTSSWLVRIAIAQGIKLESLCNAVWGRRLGIWNRDIDKCPQEQVFEVLSEKTLTPMEQVLETHLSSYQGKLYCRHNPCGNTNWILPLGVYHRTRRGYGQQFCPVCLEEEVYLRKHWRLSFSTCCEKHGIRLLDRCPKCTQPLHFHRDDMGNKGFQGRGCPALCFNCNFDLRKASTIAAGQSEVTRQKLFLEHVRTGEIVLSADQIVPSFEFFDVLHHLSRLCVSSYPLARNIGEHAAAAIGFDWQKPPRTALNASIEGLGISDRANLLQVSSWLLDEWPTRFIDHCVEHEIWSSALTKDFDKPPEWYRSVVQGHLKRDLWKGKPDPRSKRAKNWKPIDQVLASKSKRFEVTPLLNAA